MVLGSIDGWLLYLVSDRANTVNDLLRADRSIAVVYGNDGDFLKSVLHVENSPVICYMWKGVSVLLCNILAVTHQIFDISTVIATVICYMLTTRVVFVENSSS